MVFSSNKIYISVAPETPYSLLPGDPITGTIRLNLTKALSVSDLRLTFYGRGYSHIFRQYLFSFAFADWYGQGFMFERTTALLEGPTTLPPGDHEFNFAIQVPEASEPVRKNFKGLIRWKERQPFAGKGTTHDLPPTMAMEGRNQFGYTEAAVEYVLKAEIKKGPEARLLSMSLKETRPVSLTTLQPSLPAASPHHQLVQLVATRAGPVNISIDVPQILVQGDAFQVMMRADRDGFTLEGFTISVHSIYAARGRSIIWPEKLSKTTETYQLGSWDGATNALRQQFLTAGGPYTLPESVPVRFATFNVACLAHWLEIRFTLRDPNENKKVKGGFPDLPISVYSSVTRKAPSQKPLSRKPVNRP